LEKQRWAKKWTLLELRWKYYVALPILFSGEHSFIIEQVESDKIRFIDREIFNGLLVSSQTKDMDEALKTRAEQH
jgi:hypothetical protein